MSNPVAGGHAITERRAFLLKLDDDKRIEIAAIGYPTSLFIRYGRTIRHRWACAMIRSAIKRVAGSSRSTRRRWVQIEVKASDNHLNRRDRTLYRTDNDGLASGAPLLHTGGRKGDDMNKIPAQRDIVRIVPPVTGGHILGAGRAEQSSS
jgi:hypothetical protein